MSACRPVAVHLQVGLLRLEILVSGIADKTTDEDDGVQADTETGRVGVVAGVGSGGAELGLGVALLNEQSVVS